MEQLVKYETSQLARELGFEEYCYGWFYIYPKGTYSPKNAWQIHSVLEEDEIHELIGGQHGKTISEKYKNSKEQPHILARPTQALLHKWLLDVHNLYVCPLFTIAGYTYNIYDVQKKSIEFTAFNDNCYYETHEIAFEKGLFDALTFIQNSLVV